MSAEINLDGEVGRSEEVVLFVHPNLQDLVEGVSRFYGDAVEGVIQFSDEQLAQLQLGLDTITAAVSTERQRRQQQRDLREIFGNGHLSLLSEQPASRQDHALHVVHVPALQEPEVPVTHVTASLPAAAPELSVEAAPAQEATSDQSADFPQEAAVIGTVERIPHEHMATTSIRLVLARTAPGSTLRLGDFLVDTPLGRNRSNYAASQMFRRYVQDFLDSGQLVQTGKGAGTRYKIAHEPVPLGKEVVAETPVEIVVGQTAVSTEAIVPEPEPISDEPPAITEAEVALEVIPQEEIVEPTPVAPEVPVLSGEVIVLNSKGFGIHCLPNGSYELVLDSRPVKGLEEFGRDPVFALIGLSLRIYSAEVRIVDLVTLVERLGGDTNRHLLTSMLQKMKNLTAQNGVETLRHKENNDAWSLTYAVNRDRAECVEVLRRFGLNEQQAQRFLA